jgi:hypothetical protein
VARKTLRSSRRGHVTASKNSEHRTAKKEMLAQLDIIN